MPTAQRVYTMLGNEVLWQTAVHCDGILMEAGIPYSVCGGVAVCLHGYQRNTTDLELIIRPSDSTRVREALLAAGYSWNDDRREMTSPCGIAVHFVISGERAGKDPEVKVPDPLGDANIEIIEALPVLRLSKLIETKIACGLGNVRRTHKDLADVVELIDIRRLDSSFAQLLHKSLRTTFQKLVRNARGEAS